MSRRGTLLLVVGPSGVGKDSIISAAARRLDGEAGIIFARRIITRAAPSLPSDAGGEAHVAVSPGEFAALRDQGKLMLHWQAHGFDYGLPRKLAASLVGGISVVANVSRTVVADARATFAPVVVVAVTAAPSILARRLAGRGRESVAEIDRRLQRAGAISPDQADYVINNDGPLELAVERFVGLLRQTVGQAARG